MLPEDMKVNNRVSVVVESLEFESEILIIKEEYILLKLIVIDDKILNFPQDVKVNFVYYGEADKLYIWDDVVITPVKYKDGNKYHKLNKPVEEGKKYNRRSNYRLYIGEEMYIDILRGTERVRNRVMIKDVSATGFAFLFNEEYEIGNKVTLNFTSKSGKRLELPSKIVRKQFMENINTNLYGCEYNEPSDIMRKMINEQQQQDIKKRLQ